MAEARRTLIEKIWDRHQVTDLEGERLLYVDYLLLHEGARHAFDDLEATGRKVHRPRQVIACADHYVPTRGRGTPSAASADPAIRGMIERLARNAGAHGLPHFGLDHPQQGIL